MIAVIYWDRFFPVDDGGRIRTWNTARMFAAHEKVKIISFTHFQDPLLLPGRTISRDIEVIQLDLASPGFDLAYRLSTLLTGYPTLIPESVRSAVLEQVRDCDVVVTNGLRPFSIFTGSGKLVVANLCDIDWRTYRFVLQARNRLLLAHWPLVGRWTFNRFLRRADRVFVPSVRDKDILIRTNRRLVADRIVVLPNCVDIDSFPPPQTTLAGRAQTERPTVVFSGTMNYFPNLDAVQIIAKHIAPALPEADFLLVGKEPPDHIGLPPNVRFTGLVASARDLISSAEVCICPLRFGEGTRVKILEYLAAGKPVVSTLKGAEGLDVSHGDNIILADDWGAFCAEIRVLLADPEYGWRLGQAGRRLVAEKYHFALYEDAMRNVLADLRRPKR